MMMLIKWEMMMTIQWWDIIYNDNKKNISIYIYIYDGIYMTIKQIPVKYGKKRIEKDEFNKRWHEH